MFGDKTRSNIVWGPNAVDVLLSGKTCLITVQTKKCFPVFDQMFVDVPIVSHTIKQGV